MDNFFAVIRIRRCKCLCNGCRSIVQKVNNEIITKGFFNPLSLAPLGSFIVILLKDFLSMWLFIISIGVLDSASISEETLVVVCISFIGNMFSKNVASRHSRIVSTCILGTSDLT